MARERTFSETGGPPPVVAPPVVAPPVVPPPVVAPPLPPAACPPVPSSVVSSDSKQPEAVKARATTTEPTWILLFMTVKALFLSKHRVADRPDAA